MPNSVCAAPPYLREMSHRKESFYNISIKVGGDLIVTAHYPLGIVCCTDMLYLYHRGPGVLPGQKTRAISTKKLSGCRWKHYACMDLTNG